MNDKQKVKLTNSKGRDLAFRNFANRSECFLTELDLYKLIFQSRVPKYWDRKEYFCNYSFLCKQKVKLFNSELQDLGVQN